MVKENYERTLRELREAADGDLSLGEADPDNGPWSGEVELVGPKRKFRNLDGF
jgi:phage gp36-like protein